MSNQGQKGGRRGRRHGAGNAKKVFRGEIDTGLLGLDVSRKISEKPHCPGCGRLYKGSGKKKGVTLCGYCKRGRKGKADHIARIDSFIDDSTRSQEST